MAGWKKSLVCHRRRSDNAALREENAEQTVKMPMPEEENDADHPPDPSLCLILTPCSSVGYILYGKQESKANDLHQGTEGPPDVKVFTAREMLIPTAIHCVAAVFVILWMFCENASERRPCLTVPELATVVAYSLAKINTPEGEVSSGENLDEKIDILANNGRLLMEVGPIQQDQSGCRSVRVYASVKDNT